MSTRENGSNDGAGAKAGFAARVVRAGTALPSSPAAERNKDPILDVLRRVLPATGKVLEIASGTGQHAVHFAAALPQLTWQPTEPDEDLLAVIRQRADPSAVQNVLPALKLDVLEHPWPVSRADALLCVNMIHIAPWGATEALFRGAGAVLDPSAPLVLYGPYRVKGRPTAPSNEAFDASLKSRDPSWGLRDLDEVAAVAARFGFRLEETVDLPANNLVVIFRREGTAERE